MAHALSDHFVNDSLVKAKRLGNQKDPKPLPLGTKCLRYFVQPPSECAKLFRNWKGIFIVKEQLDENTYVVCREDDPRKKYIVHRTKLRPLGQAPEDQTCPKQEEDQLCPDLEPPTALQGATETVSATPLDTVGEAKRRSQRLKDKTTDFKKYFYVLK